MADVGLDRTEHGVRRPVTAHLGERGQLDLVPDLRTGAVPLDQLHVIRRDPGHLVGAIHGQPLTIGPGPGEPARTVRRSSPAGEPGVGAQPGAFGLLGTHQRHHAAALAGQEPGGRIVVNPHPIHRQRAGSRETDELERVEAEVHAPREGEVEVPVEQCPAGRHHRQQAGGAGTVHGEAGTVEVEVVAHPAGDRVRQRARQRLVTGHGELIPHQLAQQREGVCRAVPLDSRPVECRGRGPTEVRPPQPQLRRAGELPGERVAQHHADPVAVEPGPVRESGVDQCLGGGLQGQPVHMIHSTVQPAGHPEPLPVEPPVAQQPGMRQIGAVAVVGRSDVRAGQSLLRHPPERAPPCERGLPQIVRRRCVRIAARDTDDRDLLVPAHDFSSITGVDAGSGDEDGRIAATRSTTARDRQVITRAKNNPKAISFTTSRP